MPSLSAVYAAQAGVGVHAVMAKKGILPARTRMFGPSRRAQLEEMNMAPNYTTRVESLRHLVTVYDREVIMLEVQIQAQLRDHPGYAAIRAIRRRPHPGCGLHRRDRRRRRFALPERLCSSAGLTPKHRESDTKVVRGPITKQGSKLLRWAAVEAVAKNRVGVLGDGWEPPQPAEWAGPDELQMAKMSLNGSQMWECQRLVMERRSAVVLG